MPFLSKFRYSPEAVLAVALIITGSWLRVDWAVTHSPTDFVFSDPERHWDVATHPLEKNPMAGIDPPAYELLLEVIARITLGDRMALAVYAALLSLVTPFVWYLFARTVLQRKLWALWFWAALTWLPSWVCIFSYFMNETLLLPLLGMSLWLTTRPAEDTGGQWVGLNLSWISTCLTRIIALPLAVVALIFALRNTQHRLRRAILTIAIWGCVLTPFAYRSYQILNVVAPFGLFYPNHIYWESGQRDLYLHFAKPSDGTAYNYYFADPQIFDEPLRPFSDYKIRPSGSVHVFVNLDRGAADWRAADAQQAPDFPKRLHLYGENALVFLLGDSWPDNNRSFTWQDVGYHFHWTWAVIVLGSVLGALAYTYRRRRLELLPILAVVSFVVPLLSNAGVMQGRYRKPLEGIFILTLFWLAEKVVASWRPNTHRADQVLQRSERRRSAEIVVTPSG